MADAARGLGVDSGYLGEKCAWHCELGRSVIRLISCVPGLCSDADIARYIAQVDAVEEKVGDLERIVKELDEWTGELGM